MAMFAQVRADNQLVAAVLFERKTRRRALRLWRVVSIVAGVGLGLLGWPLGLAAFLFFQFMVYATYWHSVHAIEQATGLTAGEQAILFEAIDSGALTQSAADRKSADE